MPNAAEAIASTLTALGVEFAYCLPGEETIDLLDAFDAAGVTLIVTRHEQHAAFMAAAHGRLTGQPGVLVTTLGPGATNALTAISQAHLCGFPLLMLCGQKPLRENEEGSFQVLDLVRLAEPITRFATAIADEHAAAVTIEGAYQKTLEARPGPVLVVVPEDVAAAAVAYPQPIEQTRGARSISDETAAALSELIANAKAPVILAGTGAQAHDASQALERLAVRSGLGVVATQMGKGAIPEDHPQSLRSLGQNSPDTASIAVLSADLVITVGYHPTEHPPLAWHPDETVPVVHIDGSAPAVEPGYRPTFVAVGDIAEILDRLTVEPWSDRSNRTAELRAAIERSLASETRPQSFPPTALDIALDVRNALRRDDIVALDNGVYKLWFARHYPALDRNTLLLDNALATMGAGLATAMVAARLHPERNVVAICGDGGFLMNCQDLIGCLDLPNLIILVARDEKYGFIAWHQQEQGVDETAVSLRNPDFAALAEAFGIRGERVTDDDQLGTVLRRSLAEAGPVLIDCPIDQSRNDELGEERYRAAQHELAAPKTRTRPSL